MQAADIQLIGSDLAIRWQDGSESYLTPERVRRGCPCAGCMGEKDIFGTTYEAPKKPYSANAFRLVSSKWVGTYAWQPQWADGHNTGLYTWEYLRRLAEDAAESAVRTPGA